MTVHTKVHHKEHGEGVVIKTTASKVYVVFNGKQMIFDYPEAFEKGYLEVLSSNSGVTTSLAENERGSQYSEQPAPIEMSGTPKTSTIEFASKVIDLDDETVLLNQKPIGVSWFGKFYTARSWKMVLLTICEILYKENTHAFDSLIDNNRVPGRKGIYSMTRSEERYPSQIPGADFWIHTKMGSEEIRENLIDLLQRNRISPKNVQLYLK